MEPQAVPLHPGPETLQFTTRLGFEFGAGVIVAVYATVAPVFTEAGPLSVSVKLLVTVIAALAAFEGTATLRAVSVTLGGEVRICGAVKSPLESTVPQAAPEQPDPLTLQFAARLGFPVPVTVAANCRNAPSSTGAVPGDTVMETSLVTVTVAEALFEGSATLVAATVRAAGDGMICGAVYSPAFEIVPTMGFPPETPFTLQLTPGLVVLVTVAVNC